MKTNIHQALTAVAIALLTGSALTADVVDIPAFVPTGWQQKQPYNDFAPMRAPDLMDNGYRGRSATGCTAISFAQVMNYWQWPALINKSNTVEHQLRKSSTELSTYVGTTTIRFNGWTPFDYNLQDTYPEYRDDNSAYDLRGFLAESVRFPVARLTLFADSLAETLFGSVAMEPYGNGSVLFNGGSGAYIETALKHLEDWYEPTTKYTLNANNLSDVSALIESDLQNGMPVLVMMSNGQSSSHAIYAHSWNRDESGNITIGVNLGWGGVISEHPFTTDYFTTAWTGLKPKKMTQVVPLPKIVSGTATLNWYFPDCHADDVQSFKITAETDIETTGEAEIFNDDFATSKGDASNASVVAGALKFNVSSFGSGNLKMGTYYYNENNSVTLCEDAKVSFRVKTDSLSSCSLKLRAGADTFTTINLSGTSDWTTHEFTISGYANQSLAFDFCVTADSSVGTIYIDDFVISGDVTTTTTQATILAENIDKALRTKEVDLSGLTAGQEYTFVVTPVFADNTGVVAGSTVSKVADASDQALGLPSITSVTTRENAPSAMEEGFFRECAIGTNVFVVACSEHVTSLAAHPSHLTVLPSDKVAVESLGSGQFAVVLDTTSVTNFTRMIVTLEATDTNGSKAYKDLSVLITDEVEAETYTFTTDPDSGETDEPTTPATSVVFYGFNTTTKDGYTVTLGNNEIAANGIVTITDKPLVIERAEWSGDTGITVILKYTNLDTATAAALITSSMSGVGESGIGIHVNADGTSHGVWQNASWTDSTYNGGSIAEEGYLIFTYKYDAGVNVYSETNLNEAFYAASDLKSSGKNVGGNVCIGGLYNNSTLLASGLAVEAVGIYEGVLSSAAITTAIADMNANAPAGEVLSTADPAKWVWIGGTGSADAPGDWATTANWEWRDANNVKTVSQPAESHYPSKNNTNDNAWLPIEIEGSSATPVYVNALSANQVEGWKLRIALSYAHVTIENLVKFQNDACYLRLKNASTLSIPSVTGHWNLSEVDIEDGSKLQIAAISGLGNQWAFNVDTHQSGLLELTSWTPSKTGTFSFELNVSTDTTNSKLVRERVLASWTGDANNLNFNLGTVTGGVGTDTDALTLATEDLSAYPVGTYNFVKDTDAKKYLVYYVDYSNPGETEEDDPQVVDGTKPPSNVIIPLMCLDTDWSQQSGAEMLVDGYFCGCDALAWGQVVTYHALNHNHPVVDWERTSAFENTVTVNGTEKTRSTVLGLYDWNAIKDKDKTPVFTAEGVSLSHVQRLFWDLGVIGNMEYKSGGSAGTAWKYGEMTPPAYFEYQSCGRDYSLIQGGSQEERRERTRVLLRASLQVGAPVVTDVLGHVMVTDGWGIDENGTEWFHIDKGYGSGNTIWRNVDALVCGNMSGTDVNTLDIIKVIALVHPTEELKSVVVGRVATANYAAVESATVTLTAEDGTVYTTTTDSRGLYAFKNLPLVDTETFVAPNALPKDKYTLCVTKPGYQAVDPVEVLIGGYITDEMRTQKHNEAEALGYDDFYPYDIGCAVADVTLTEKESVTPAFDWTPGSTPTGWFTAWGEAGGSTKTVVSTNSAPENLYVVYHDGDGENQKWHPWVNMSSKNSFTLATYGCADMVQAPAGKLAVLWCMGSRGGSKILLAKDEQNHIKLLQTSGTTVPTTVIDAGEVSGYHLFTVRFSTETGLSLQIDNGEVKTDATLTTAAANGFQVGAIYEGIYPTDFERGLGFIVCKMIGYDSADCSATQYAELCATYPAVATMNALAYSTAGGALYLPSLTLASGTLRVKNGVLEVPTGVTASLKSLEFGDQNDPIPTFGMNLAGALTVTANQIFEGNGYDNAYTACNNNNGVNLGEWTGNGTYNITGSFVADGAIVELCHDAATSALNINGGVFKVKGVTSRYNGRTTITLTNNGTINYGQYASAAAMITKNYGHGTVTGTASWTDTDAITLTDAANGTTFLADSITQTYTGAISGDGKAIIHAPNGGKVVFKNFTATAVQVDAGTLELALTNAQLTDGATLLGGATVDVADGAQITLAGADSVSLYTPTIQDDGTLKLVLRQPGADDMATGAVLRIREIMPKGSETNLDPNGLESGWVEVENTSTDKWADLADYCFTRINRSKKLKANPYGNFPSVLIPPGGRVVFYTSESYPNAAGFVEDGDKCNLFATPDPDGAVPKFYPEYNNVLVWPDKVNPKKHPFVRLYYAPADGDLEIVDTVVVPSDLPEDASILVGDVTEGQSTLRWICTEPTKGTANPSTEGLTRLGPNVGPLYEFEYNDDYKKKYVASEFEMKNFTKEAKVGEAYTVTLPINPVMAPTGTTANDNDAITSVKLLYRKGFGNGTIVDGEPIEMTQSTVGDYNWGQRYTATIPADFITAEDKGQLIQWKVEMTDASGATWTSPSFHNKDDGYEWYGTIVDPGTYDETNNPTGLNSATLPTWHMFADAASVSQMDKDNPDQDVAVTPHNARVVIYDWSTKTYYDYVRIDLRGNTSASFAKKSHGLRFAKAHPLTMEDSVRGGEVEEFRKSSLISEFGDPSWMRQMVAFWLFDKMGNKTPFDFPVRCNLNGAFYQLAFHSERFTDELIEDYYGLDKFGYGYKNVGTLKSGSGTSAGDIEKKTPDDGNEGDVSVLQAHLRLPLYNRGAENDNTTEREDLTQFVVEKFDLPAWLNYIASSKITQEMDDVWANISAYYDSPTMRDGTTRGTGTWMPLAYDFNLSFGQWYYNDASGAHAGLMADEDWFKSHPFYGGNRVRCYKQAAMTEPCNTGNSAYEAIFQNEKFRRLYLRRLRTLMDAELKAPGTPESEVPFMVKMRELAELMRVDSKLDQAKWPNDGTDNAIDVWQATNDRPTDIDAGIDEIWEKYVVPRQTHLYVTHGAEYATEESPIGYASTARAGIPAAQSPIRDLRQGITAEYNATLGAVIIRNTNAEVIDVSNWVLAGPIEMTLPAGTVLDQGTTDAPGEVYVTADRRTTIAAMTLTDQVVVGNGVAGDAAATIALAAADGTKVIYEPIEVETTTGEAGITLTSPDEIQDCVITLTEEDVEAGMSDEHLVLKLVETVDENGATVYSAVIAITPERTVVPLPTVELAPAWEAPEGDIPEEDVGKQTIAIQINNAVKGLWYGYEVTTDLKNTPFAHDVHSFKRATGETIRVKGSPRTDPAAFFRVKVLPAAPTK